MSTEQKKEDSKLAVTHNGKIQYYLNSRLVADKKLTDDEIWKLVELHEQKLVIFEEMATALVPEEIKLVRELAAQITKIEFRLQEIWKFPKDENFHAWYRIPHCSCPKLDNDDCRGTPKRFINPRCYVHGVP